MRGDRSETPLGKQACPSPSPHCAGTRCARGGQRHRYHACTCMQVGMHASMKHALLAGCRGSNVGCRLVAPYRMQSQWLWSSRSVSVPPGPPPGGSPRQTWPRQSPNMGIAREQGLARCMRCGIEMRTRTPRASHQRSRICGQNVVARQPGSESTDKNPVKVTMCGRCLRSNILSMPAKKYTN